MKFRSVLVAGIAALFVSQPGWIWAQSSRLDVVKSRGTLLCGVNPSFAGFSLPDSTGQWHGFDVDICRAVAAAVFGDAGKVKYVALSAKERLTRNVQLGVNFIGTNFYDGQAFMVKADSKIKSVRDLDGASICAISGADTERNLSDYFRSHGMKFKSVSFENADNVAQAYFAGRCDAIINDRSQLASLRSLAPDPKEHIVLPEIISTEPLSPSVRAGDDQWANVVRWSFYAMVQAEDLGLQSTTVRATISTSQNPNVLRFAGKIEDLGGMLGLDREWAVRIVEQVGNYGESYERNIKPIGLDRGINRLWKDGGIIIAPPIR